MRNEQGKAYGAVPKHIDKPWLQTPPTEDRIRSTGAGGDIVYEWDLNGNLTIRGVTSDLSLEVLLAGGGLVVPTPDGTDRYRIHVDNSGNVVSTGPL